jgi:hypothetical protein
VAALPFPVCVIVPNIDVVCGAGGAWGVEG